MEKIRSFIDEIQYMLLQDDSCSDDSDFDEQIMQHLVAAASRAHYIRRRERQRSPGAGPSEAPVFDSSVQVSGLHPALTTSPSGGSSPTSGLTSAADIQPPPAVPSPVDLTAINSSPETDAPFKARYLMYQTVVINYTTVPCVIYQKAYDMSWSIQLLIFNMFTVFLVIFRVLYSQPPSEGVRRLNTSEMFSFPESIKSKFSAASAR